MRIMGFSEERRKLKKAIFTTFRFPRRDTDWRLGEEVQVVLNPRSKRRKVLGVAMITNKKPRKFVFLRDDAKMITQAEAKEDGFENLREMRRWFDKAHGSRVRQESLNKLTLVWKERFE